MEKKGRGKNQMTDPVYRDFYFLIFYVYHINTQFMKLMKRRELGDQYIFCV